MKSSKSSHPFSTLWTRREFVHRSSTAAMLAVTPTLRFTSLGDRRTVHEAAERTARRANLMDAATVRALTQRAIDAAKSAGAVYAEARVTRIVTEEFSGAGLFLDREELGIGVRALVQGAWGFAASPYLELDEAAQLGRDAVAQALTNARVDTRSIELGTYPVATGSWSTPIRIDPFAIPFEEKSDYVKSLSGLMPRHVDGRDIQGGMGSMVFVRQERAVATTEGAFFTQTLYTAGGKFTVQVTKTVGERFTNERQITLATGLAPAGGGWELILDAKVREQIPRLIEEANELLVTPVKPVEIGRYDIVCDAASMATLVGATLGNATELDRALGDEANAGGTSYLGPDPFEHLGTTLGTPLLNLHGTRSLARGLATVQWDDEGVRPDEFTIVQDGVLVDYQTTREQAAWLAPWYQKRGQAVRSHGCAVAASALATPIQCTPNLVMTPGTSTDSFADLVAATPRGIALMGSGVNMDFQSRDGGGQGFMRQIVNGKLGAIIVGGGFLFDSMQFWKNLHAVGGAASQVLFPGGEVKGQPSQHASHSVAAVPGIIKEMAIIDIRRKV
jgi:TldD protein